MWIIYFTGLMPYNFICVQTGSMLSQISSMEDVFTSGTFLKLAAIALVALVPSFIMKKLKNNKLKAVWSKLMKLYKNCFKLFMQINNTWNWSRYIFCSLKPWLQVKKIHVTSSSKVTVTTLYKSYLSYIKRRAGCSKINQYIYWIMNVSLTTQKYF